MEKKDNSYCIGYDTSQIGIQYIEVLSYEDRDPEAYWGYGDNTGFHVIPDNEE